MRQCGPLHHEMLLSHKAASEVYEQPQTLDWKVGATICGYGIASAHVLLSSGHSLLYQGIFQTSPEEGKLKNDFFSSLRNKMTMTQANDNIAPQRLKSFETGFNRNRTSS